MTQQPPNGMPTPYPGLLYRDAPAAIPWLTKAAGAEITMAPHDNDYGGRGYAARDLEGNEWSFGSYVPSGGDRR